MNSTQTKLVVEVWCERIWLAWAQPWPQLHPTPSAWIETLIVSQSFRVWPQLCSCGWMGADPCSQVPKSFGKPSQKRGGCYSSRLMHIIWKWDFLIMFRCNVQVGTCFLLFCVDCECSTFLQANVIFWMLEVPRTHHQESVFRKAPTQTI